MEDVNAQGQTAEQYLKDVVTQLEETTSDLDISFAIDQTLDDDPDDLTDIAYLLGWKTKAK